MRTVLGLLVVVLASCASPSPAPETSAPSSGPSDAETGDLPAACAPVDLRGPAGERVDLTGQWDVNPGFSATARVYLNQVGGCVFGSYLDGYLAGFDIGDAAIANLDGQIRTNFTVDLTIVFVYQDIVFPYGEYSSTTMLIEWDDQGTIRLREDLERGQSAGRCTNVAFECVPIILTPAEAGD